MARWYLRKGGRYYRYGRFRGFRRGYRKRYGYSRRYVNATSKSSVRMKTAINTTMSLIAGYGPDATGAAVLANNTLGEYRVGTPNSASLSAANSPLYRTYCNLYEECKVIGMKVNLSIVSAVGGSDIPSVQIYTAWDRKHGSQDSNPSADDIRNASSSAVATALNNNVAKLTRSCYASDLMEKATWFDSTLASSANGYRNQAWYAAGANPNMFCPSFQFMLNCPSLGATTNISVSLSIVYYFAFRNPRFGGTGSAKLVDLGSVPRSAPDDGGDMDDAAAPSAPPDADDDDLDDDEVHDELTRINGPAKRNADRAEQTHKARMARIVRSPIIPKN